MVHFYCFDRGDNSPLLFVLNDGGMLSWKVIKIMLWQKLWESTISIMRHWYWFMRILAGFDDH